MKMFLVLLIVIFVTACEKIQGDPSQEKWTENVKLQNGEVLQVKREERHGQGEAGTSGGPLTYSSLEFEYRGKQYKWESGNTAPWILQVDDAGRPVVYSTIGYDWARRQRGNPCSNGVLEIHDGVSWIQYPSWELHVSSKINLAANAEKGRQGISAGDEVGPLPPNINYLASKKKCMNTEGENNVQ
jgi:hypothetical protein